MEHTCKYCGATMWSNEHAADHAGECPVMNAEPPFYVVWLSSAQQSVQRICGRLCRFWTNIRATNR